jgi:ferredoxin
MATDVYERLASHLDNLPFGYPRTESGVELRILRRLFTPEEAELALHLTLIAEDARVIARRAGIPVEEAGRRLQEMERKGLIFVYHRPGKEPQYQAIHYVIGIYEFQVNRLDPENVQDYEEYANAAWNSDVWQRAPQLRTIPVGESISAQSYVLPYEQTERLLGMHDTFAVAPCICRRERQIAGHGCDRPMEACLVFGHAAEFYVHNKLGRKISREEALQILKQAEEAGLVAQPGNAKEPLNICNCFGCCCGVLRQVKRHPKPASVIASPFVAVLDVDLCAGCGTCEARCQMEAISVDDGYAVLDLDRCIGCGLCVTTCPTEALSLVRKPEAEQRYVPKNAVDANIKLGQARGKLGVGELLRMLVRSKVDRLLALR